MVGPTVERDPQPFRLEADAVVINDRDPFVILWKHQGRSVCRECGRPRLDLDPQSPLELDPQSPLDLRGTM